MTTIANSQAQAGLANNQRAAQELQDKTRNINSLKQSLMPQEDKEKKLREACEGFETIFVKKMWEDMQATIHESDFLKSRDEKHWRSMYNQELAETLTAAGGIGLADMMYKQLSGDLANATRATVATSFSENTAGFEIKPVPLINSSDMGNSQNFNATMNSGVQNIANNQHGASSQLGDNTKLNGQNTNAMYTGEANQPISPNMDAIQNQSIQNAHDAIANINPQHLNSSNAGVIQNVLEQLKAQKTRNSDQDIEGKATAQTTLNSQMQGQNNAPNSVYSANVSNNQQNHVLQPNSNTQPVRNNVYTAPIVNKVGNGVVLPSANTYTPTENTARRLPKQATLNQTQVHGSPGITPANYINTSPFVVKAPAENTNRDSNVQVNSSASAAQGQAQGQTQGYTPANAQIRQMEQVPYSLTRQNVNLLPSERKLNNI